MMEKPAAWAASAAVDTLEFESIIRRGYQTLENDVSAMNGEESQSGVTAAACQSPAAEGLASEFGDRLMRAAFILCRNEADAQDLVQETFCRAFKYYGSYDGRSALYTWLYGILRNVFLMFCRKKRQGSFFPFELADRADDPGPESNLERNAERIRVARALDALSLKDREVLHLRYMEDMKMHEIAGALSVSEGTVKSRLHHAKRRLKKAMKRGAPSRPVSAEEEIHEV